MTGQVPRAQRGSGSHREIDLSKRFDDICDYRVSIETPSQMPRMVEIAVPKALPERCVVRIKIPHDIIEQDVPRLAEPMVAAVRRRT
jgi:pyruvate dehydrogenase (quinone)